MELCHRCYLLSVLDDRADVIKLLGIRILAVVLSVR